MANYRNIISHGDAEVLQPEQEILDGIVTGIVKSSKILPLMNRLRDGSSSSATMTVVDGLPLTYFVDEGINNGLKQTTKMAWKNKKIFYEEIASIIVMKQNDFDDAKTNIWEQAKPLLIQDSQRLLDEAILTGRGKPATWREGLIPSIINAGKSVAPNTNNTYTQISKAMSAVEASGYEVSGIIGGVQMKGEFREGLLDQTGQPLNPTSEVMQLNRVFVDNGAWDNSLAKFIVGDLSQAVYSVRKDHTFEVFNTGVITDADGNVIHNLMQEDLIAIRYTFRFGWEIPNPVNILDSGETRFPFALVENTAPATTYEVEITVNDGEGTPLQNAKVSLGGITKKTNSSGIATFKSLGNTSSLFKADLAGYYTGYGEVKVETSSASATVVLNKK